MAPRVNLHRPDMISAVFDRGVFRSLKTGARIEYDSPDDLDEDNGFGGDFRGPLLLDRSVKLLIAAPYNLRPFSSIKNDGNAGPALSNDVVGNNECPFSNLVLVNMQPRIGPSINIVDVEVSYEHIMEGYNQILINPPSGRLFVKARTNIVDKTTNFFRKEGSLAFPKTQLEVAHTFPESDLDITNFPFSDALPRTVVQTGEITVPFPSKGFTLQGIIFTNDIVSIAKRLVAHVNAEPLLGEGEFYWVCSEFSWELHNAFPTAWQPGGPAYKVSIEFQYNYDSWDVDVLFNDKRTGQPPANLVKADIEDGNNVLRYTGNTISGQLQPAGQWRVPYLPRRNFTAEFGGVRWEAVGII